MKTVKEIKGNVEVMKNNDAIGDFWKEIENLALFEEKTEVLSYATNCAPIGTLGCC